MEKLHFTKNEVFHKSRTLTSKKIFAKLKKNTIICLFGVKIENKWILKLQKIFS